MIERRCADCRAEAAAALADANRVLAATGDALQLEPDLSRIGMWKVVAELHDEGAPP